MKNVVDYFTPVILDANYGNCVVTDNITFDQIVVVHQMINDTRDAVENNTNIAVEDEGEVEAGGSYTEIHTNIEVKH